MAEPLALEDRRKGVQGAQVHAVAGTGLGIHVYVACVEGSEVLEEVRALAGVYAEVRQRTFHQRLGFGDVAPDHRHAQGGDAGAPSAETDEDILPSLGP